MNRGYSLASPARPRPSSRHRRQNSSRLLLRLSMVGAAVALLLLVLGFQVAYAGRIYPGVHALGTDLGGQTHEEARLSLERRAAEFAERPITLRFQSMQWTATGRDLGLNTDMTPLLESAFALGREGNLLNRFTTQMGLWRDGRSFDPSAALYDPAAQAAVLQAVARDVDRPVVDARIDIRPDGEIGHQPAQTGRFVDVEATVRRLQDYLPQPGPQQVDLVVSEVAPRVNDGHVGAALEQARAMLVSPVILQFQDKQWQLGRSAIAQVLRVVPAPDGQARLEVNRSSLVTLAERIGAEIDQEPQDARFDWSGGALRVIRPSRDGRKLDRAAMLDVLAARLGSEERVIDLPVAHTPAAVRMEDKENLGITGLIESARTSFASGVPAKQHNITLASSRIHGTVVAPGKMFSFNREVGATSIDAGFQVGWGIASTGGGNHRTVPSVAGGICQVATTLFQTVFWSGYQIEERNWHLYWIPSYTSKGVVGLDATVDEEAGLDFKFINTTKNHILIQSWVDGAKNLNFALYSSKPPWTVKVEPQPKTDIVDAETDVLIQEEPSMPKGQRIQVEGAQDGFNITIIRRVNQDGEERTLRLGSRYKPAQNLIMVGTGGEAPGPTRVESNRPQRSEPGASGTPAATPRPVAAGSPAPTVATPPRTPTQAAAVQSEPSATPQPAQVAPPTATRPPATAAPTATSAPKPDPTRTPTRTPTPRRN